MTSILDGQALTRRERRETEEHRHHAPPAPAPQAPPLIVPSAPFSTLVMEKEPGPAVAPQSAAPVVFPSTSPIARAVSRSYTAPVSIQPSARSYPAPSRAPERPTPSRAPERPTPSRAPERPTPSRAPERPTPAAAQPLSRRERRLHEQPSAGGHGLTHSSPASLPTSAPLSAPVVAPGGAYQEAAPPVYAPSAYAPSAYAPTAYASSVYVPPVAQSYPAPPAPQAPPEPTVSMGVGHVTGPSSLILLHSPSVDLAGPLGDNGEIIVTGQIRISPHVVERGTAPFQYVSKDEDDSEIVYSTVEDDAMVKPVPASHAVASKSNNAELALMRSTRWGTGAIVTVLSISVFAVAAVTLLALSLTTGVLL